MFTQVNFNVGDMMMRRNSPVPPTNHTFRLPRKLIFGMQPKIWYTALIKPNQKKCERNWDHLVYGVGFDWFISPPQINRRSQVVLNQVSNQCNVT